MRFAGARLWLSVGLLVLISLFEGSGLLLLVPLLHTLGFSRLDALHGLAKSLASPISDPSPGRSLGLILAAFFVIKAGQACLRAWSDTLNQKLEIEFVCHLRERFYRAMMRAGWLHLTRQRSSDITQALTAELPIVGNGARQILALISVALIGLIQLAVVLTLSPEMTVLALGSGLVVGLGLRRLRQRALALAKLGYGKRAEMAAAVNEHLAGMKIAKGHGRETQHFRHFQRAMHEIADYMMGVQRNAALTNVWIQTGAVGALSLFVWTAVRVQHVDGASLLMLAYVFTRLLSQLTALQSIWHQIEQAQPPFAESEEMRTRFEAAAEPPLPAVFTRIDLGTAIRVEGLSFRYDPAQPAYALREIDLVLPAREVTALCGSSGAGKSTLADALLGLIVPESGRVLIDGQPLAGDRLHHWRQSIGYVPQDTFLFHETVRNNLLWAQPDATEDEVRAALRTAAADEFVARLPNGLDTVVGDRGVRLSGGERQRIALARALLRRPTVLILDEATSSLDTHNERLVQDAIERLQGEITIVLIAHRLSTIRFADRIAVLAAGRIAEIGTWDELNSRPNGLLHQLALAGAT